MTDDEPPAWVVRYVEREYYTVTVRAETYEEACDLADLSSRRDPGSTVVELELLDAEQLETT